MKIINSKNNYVRTTTLTYCFLMVALLAESASLCYGRTSVPSYTGLRSTTEATVDSDGDGLTDTVEIRIGTDPRNWDSDNDRLSDGDEVEFGSDPLVYTSDADGDGINNYDEIHRLGSDPFDGDTDGDGIPDMADCNESQFLILGMNATDFDEDLDGISDYLERFLKLDRIDVRSSDKDNDGIQDKDELFDPHHRGIKLHDVLLDTDNDGVPNYEDPDDDGDGYNTIDEAQVDTNGNGAPGHLDRNEFFVVDAGEDVFADCNELVVLTGEIRRSARGIMSCTWVRLPDQTYNIASWNTEEIESEHGNGTYTVSSELSTRSLGRMEEMWELQVEDDLGNVVTDTVSVFSRIILDTAAIQ